MQIKWMRADNGLEVEKLLEELYETYKNVEILGITSGIKFNIFYKTGERK